MYEECVYKEQMKILDECGQSWEMKGVTEVSAIWTELVIWFSALQKPIKNNSENRCFKWKEVHICKEKMMTGGGAAWMRAYVYIWVCEKHSILKVCYAKPYFSC